MEGSHALAVATRAAVLAHLDPARIQGYCARCPWHGVRWSCPPFDEPALERFGAWTHAVLVGRKVLLDAPGAPEDPEAWKAWALERFEASRAEFRKILMGVEDAFPGSTALAAGRCVQCGTCARASGDPCRRPEALRVSLEAVGFDVSGLVAGILGTSLHWPRETRPGHYLTVGALFCPSVEEARSVREALELRLG